MYVHMINVVHAWFQRELHVRYGNMYKIDDGDSYTGVGRAHSDNNEEGGINIEIV